MLKPDFLKKYNSTVYYVIAGSFILNLVLILFISEFSRNFYKVDWDYDQVGIELSHDIMAGRDYQLTDEEATGKRQDFLKKHSPAYYSLNLNINSKVEDLFREFERNIIAMPSVPGQVMVNDNLIVLTSSEQLLLSDTDRLEVLMAHINTLLGDLMNAGIFLPSDLQAPDRNHVDGVIIIRYQQNGIKEFQVEVTRARMQEYGRVNYTGLGTFDETLSLSEQVLIRKIVDALLLPNCFYNEELSLRELEKTLQNLSPVIISYKKGDLIIPSGQILSYSDISLLKLLDKSFVRFNFKKIAGLFIFLIIIYLMAFGLFRYAGIRFSYTKSISILLILNTLFLLTALIVQNSLNPPVWLPLAVFLPASFFSMLVLFIRDFRTSLIFGFILSFVFLFIRNFDSAEFLIMLFSCLIGSLAIRNSRKRIDLLKTGLYLFFLYPLMYGVLSLFNGNNFTHTLYGCLILAVNGLLSSALTLTVLPVLEHFLHICTPFQLLELADLNSPILKKMLTVAPGTFGHSVNVANLAEEASRNIGADSLLARVGAYYHDIGKVDQPEYFTENQDSSNKHDDLQPSLSAAVIKSHVRQGVEKGREMNLPEEVLAIIGQHHGKGRVEYFYNKVDIESVDIKQFTYPGPNPQSHEAAIVMLADTCEAALRSQKKPTVAKIEKKVWELIMKKFQEGLLSESALTMKDLEIIKQSFVHVLAGYFHTRIEYPDARSKKQ